MTNLLLFIENDAVIDNNDNIIDNITRTCIFILKFIFAFDNLLRKSLLTKVLLLSVRGFLGRNSTVSLAKEEYNDIIFLLGLAALALRRNLRNEYCLIMVMR
jgi:hypothetical protein